MMTLSLFYIISSPEIACGLLQRFIPCLLPFPTRLLGKGSEKPLQTWNNIINGCVI